MYSCVRRYNSRLEAGANPEPLSGSAVESMAEVGKIAFGIHDDGKPAEPESAYRNAVAGYEDGWFRVFLDGEELIGLDAPIAVTENSTLTFIRLTMLAGSSFPGGSL